MLALDRAHVWHPFTQMAVWPSDDPLIIERAEGNTLIDDLGRRYLDGVSSLWCNVHGHRKREIDDAVRAQLDRVAHSTLLGLASVPSIELAEALVEVAPPGLTRVFYSDSGSTAVEVALKMTYQYWQQRGRPEKTRFAALSEAYHGDTVGSVSVGGMALFHGVFRGLLFDVERLPSPSPYHWTGGGDPLTGALDAAERLLAEKGPTLAALVIEPLVQGAAGMWMHPPGYLEALAELCRAHDVLLVCDEVATGFGRTGTMFAVEQEGVRPDFLCVAKGLAGGYLPLAATLTTERVYEAFLGEFASARTFFHGHTFTGNALACAAALASLRLFATERVLERVRRTAEVLRPGLAAIAELEHVGDVRQRGLMVGIELVRDRRTKQPYAYAERIGHQVCLALRRRGILLRPLGPVLVMMPPLSLTEAEALRLGDAVREAIVEVTEA
ncbi:MAG TPA: adenosylmethionine--8-amino-7-oxononanoate transaminase [Myxococcaceae bacterium]|nr:adenosylmethionine--8-amino-7-oxononanoate transaminase [Myxococcaceae bacterium]